MPLKAYNSDVIWHPFTQMKEYQTEEPIIIERAEGCTLIDTHGRQYLDGVSSLWVTVHGHRRPEIDAAIKAQIDRVSHSTLLGLSHVPAIELAEKLLQIVPQNLKKVFYSDSGSTAVEIALKIAFQYFQNQNQKSKKRFVALRNAYHGDTIGSVSVGGIDLFHQIYRPLLFETELLETFDLEKIEQLFREKHQELAAVIVEPMIQGAAGMLLQPTGFLKSLRELTQKYHILLIADEVATGFGRTGKMFACEHVQVEPDILCVAKGLTGGYLPLAVTLTSQAIFDGFYADYAELKTFFHGHTYTGNPLACAAALANLEIFEKENTLDQLRPKIQFLSQLLQPFTQHPHIKEVRQLGFMVGIELIKGKARGLEYSLEERIGHQVTLVARKRGVIIRPLGPVIVLMPPLSITIQELQQLVMQTFAAIDEVTTTTP